ncbi:TetR/AcrR family transcriptional regulator [Aurantimonas sp. HBX-1]|uniref:TetR/AcrR family transcriptional regulator n=1 Tax=Aurantimonas sp. HBX-1 TaxID=2906072 RepID=UPI001F2D543B|nr:TetR/AcrR family transcriptional regulator [Aurantimonas sp. HBX-1]UIJ70950.1 TetR/AcrR family transcriptional regulator [Aurantimonas sp. HBX-1]
MKTDDRQPGKSPPARTGGRSRSARDFTGARAHAEADETLAAILAAAAAAFREHGFAAASIDDVARRLGATKGLVYHYYRSKNDLFLDVCQRGMEIDFAAVETPAASRDRAVTRLRAMAEAHLTAMIRHIDFQHAILQAVSRHLGGPTTPEDGERLAQLIAARDRYEMLFRRTIADSIAEGDLAGTADAALTGRAFLSVLNAPVYWYRERPGETDADRRALVRELAMFALRGAGAGESIIEEEFGS